ncbi:MAG: TetR/AcrR family transcriptional regulator [Prolixibacteraceae bacterium]|nr:TetR/AcrR family transcriptional regulator [Prolixibacteraceae bacterium]
MELREKIIEGAGKLFLKHGVRQVTMDAIAHSLGISKRTIYENFKDKEELLSTFLKESIIEHKKTVFEIMARSENVIDALFHFGKFNQEIEKNVNPCFVNDIKKYHPKVFQKVIDSDEIRNYEISFMIIKRGVDEGIFLNDLNIDIVNLFLHHIMEFFSKVEGKNFSNSEILKSVHLPYLKGICTTKGLQLIEAYFKKEENLTNN